MSNLNSEIRRGDLYYADLSPVVGSEQGGVRPVLVIQNNIGNKYSPTIIIAAITSQINKAKLPTHIEISANEYGLNKDSVILLEQIRTIDKKRLREKIGCLDKNMMLKIISIVSERYPDIVDALFDAGSYFWSSKKADLHYCTMIAPDKYVWTSLDNKGKLNCLRYLFDKCDIAESELILILDAIKD